MDLGHLFRVLKRFRAVVAVGICLTLFLAFLSYVSVGPHGVQYRQAEKWESHSRLWVTIPGFSAGKSLAAPQRGSSGNSQTVQDAEGRLQSLAVLYAGLATGDPVLNLVRAAGPIKGTIVAVPATVPLLNGGGASLPIVDIGVTASSQSGSQKLANEVSSALMTYVRDEQNANKVRPDNRVDLSVLNVAKQSKLVAGRSKTLPIIVFLTGLMATIALVSVLENLRPRVQVVSTPDLLYEQDRPASRRSVS
jgi:capsular polysaccharide biosynthesis protein